VIDRYFLFISSRSIRFANFLELSMNKRIVRISICFADCKILITKKLRSLKRGSSLKEKKLPLSRIAQSGGYEAF